MEYIEGKHVVKCPNRLNPGVADHATKDCANCKKQQTKNSKKQNLASGTSLTLMRLPNCVFESKYSRPTLLATRLRL